MKYRGFICGLIIGSLCMMSTGIMAENSEIPPDPKEALGLKDNSKPQPGDTVEARVSDAMFKFDGNYKTPSGTDVAGVYALNYNNRLYVPVRFIAEGLDMDIEWNSIDRIVNVDTKKEIETVPETTDKTTEQTTEETTREEKTEKDANYERMPVRYSYEEMDIAATVVEKNEVNNTTKVYIRIVNRKQEPLYLNQSKAVLTANGKSYYPKDVRTVDWSTTWDKDITGTSDGYLIFPYISDDIKNIKVEFPVIVNDYTQKQIDITYYINLD